MEIVPPAIFRRTHGVAAVGAPGFPGEQPHSTAIKRLGPLRNHGLNPVPEGAVDDGLMGSLHTIPLALRAGFVLLGLVGNAAIFALHHIANINLVGEHIGDSKILPESAVFPLGLLVAQAVEPLVLGGIRDTTVVEHPGDGRLTVTLGKEGKHLPDNGGGFLINEQMAFLVGVFFVAIEGKGPNVKTILPPVGEDAADVLRHILQIPLVHQPVDLPGLLIALVGGVGVVHDADKADAPNREEAVDVLFYQLQLTGKAGLCLAENDVKAVSLGVLQQAVKFGPSAV